MEELVRSVRTFGCLQIVSNAVESETEAWCNGFEGVGSTVADAVLRLYAKLLANKRIWEDRALQPVKTEQDSEKNLRSVFLAYGWEPCAPYGDDLFCAEKVLGDARHECRNVVVTEDREGLWYAEVFRYDDSADSSDRCIRRTHKYEAFRDLLDRLDAELKQGVLDFPDAGQPED